MIGMREEDQSVLEKLKTMKVDDIFVIPNIFQVCPRSVNNNLHTCL
jgi:hypothetical protein